MVNDEHKSNLVDMTVVKLKITDRAVQCEKAYGRPARDWFPLTLVELSANEDGTHTLTCPEWKLRQAGFL